MTWFKTDDGFYDHPKTGKALSLNPLTIALWQLAGCWTSKSLTDGFVPAYQVDKFLPPRTKPSSSVLAGMLVEAGLWDVVDGGWRFHDWTDWNRDRDTVLAEREAAKQRIQDGREAAKQRMRSLRETRKSESGSPNVRRTSREHSPVFAEGVQRPESLTLTEVPEPTVQVRVAEPQTARASSPTARIAAKVAAEAAPHDSKQVEPFAIDPLTRLMRSHPLAQTNEAQEALRRWHSSGTSVDDLDDALCKMAAEGWHCTPKTLQRALHGPPESAPQLSTNARRAQDTILLAAEMEQDRLRAIGTS